MNGYVSFKNKRKTMLFFVVTFFCDTYPKYFSGYNIFHSNKILLKKIFQSDFFAEVLMF